ncbi:RrF2 family transcriptional regulator [Anaerosacchariphilus polymeriproducens]|uniref:Rrf2 family transcriptional regulator n=1 Tax=Anaerosacchariphilus polymeriproducens TaxID=1812858 RepID=A0A371AXN2_9FIRM|nr:Rrf2 family transcriptional regulator [Anaerosacchariphilus polymeriproducens]RDU24282.1 Rrf2 family transcriptional regulator [Anaerosacchariphilus polymeriproducens]
MKLSKKGIYGLRAFVDLAVYSENEPVSLSSIASRQDISVNYLEQLIAKLKKADLVKSVRGVNGGYILAKPIEEISVGEILRALEGDLTPVDCPGIKSESQCESAKYCVSKTVWKKINDSINETVNQINFGELVKESKEMQKG